MKDRQPDSTVLITEEDDSLLEDRLSQCQAPVIRFTTMEALLDSRTLESVGVLILHTKSAPRGVLLARLAQIALDHPGMQKVALMEGVLSLPLAKHLTACGFRIIRDEAESGNDTFLPQLVDEMRKRGGWMARVTA